MNLKFVQCSRFNQSRVKLPLYVIALIAVFAFGGKVSAQIPLDLGATVNSTGTINLVWSANSYQTGTTNYVSAQKLFRRVKGTTTWSGTITLTTTANTYSDTTVTSGTQYEYFLEQDLSAAQNFSGNAAGPARGILSTGNTQAFGYICAGINLPRIDNRGKLLLLVDSTMSGPLATEIAQLQQDLAGDGWTVITSNLPRQTVDPATALTGTIGTKRLNELQSVKNIIKTAYTGDPTNVKQVFILGHLPVPYSGYTNPDVHSDHIGAWPSDAYYADMTGTWTDTSVNVTGAGIPNYDFRNSNVPGDGKFDQDTIPNANPQLQVGRVDLSNMNLAPSTSVSETELLRRYLNKDHQYRFKLGPYANIQQKALAQEWWASPSTPALGAPEDLEQTTDAILGRNLAASPNVDYYSGTIWSQYCITHPTNTYLFGYCEGAGNYQGAQGGGSTTDIGSKPSPVVFTGAFGSYFGDWDVHDNYLRAFLAGNAAGNSLGLTSFWASRPGWITYPLAMGATWGEVTQTSQAATTSLYPILGTDAELNYSQFVHGHYMGLLGDPSLRLYQVQPPQNVRAQSSGGSVTLTWDATTEPAASVLGYLVFRSTSTTGPFTLLTTSPISATTYTDATATVGTTYTYMVKTLKLQNPNGGTFQNESQGSPATIADSSGTTSLASTPTGVQATVVSTNQINLTWAASTGSPTGYIIQRDPGTGTFAPLTTVSGSTTSYTDAGPLGGGAIYRYQVIAKNAIGNSLPSATVSVQGNVGVIGYTAFSAYSSPVTYATLSPASSPPEADIVIQRQGGNIGAVGVTYTTADGSAVAGVNYTAVTGTLTWTDGDSTPKTIHVPLMPSPQEPGAFYLTLSNPTNGAVIQGATQTVVLIEDTSIPLLSPWASVLFGPPVDSGWQVQLSNGEIADTSNSYNLLLDRFGRYTYQPVTGDVIMTAHVEATTPATTSDEVGIAVHNTLGSSDKMAVIQRMGGSGIRFFSTATGTFAESTTGTNTNTGAYWLRMVRSGGTLTGQMSPDNVTWTTVGSANLGDVNTFPLKANWGLWHQGGLGDYQLARFNHISFTSPPDGTLTDFAIWDFTGQSGTVDNVPVTAANPRLTLGNLARATTGTYHYVGSGVFSNMIGSEPTGHVYTTSQAAADAAGQYYQFTFTPKPGTQASLSDLDFTPYFQVLTGGVAGVAYSTDGFATTNNSVTVTGTGSYGGAAITPYKADLSSIPVFQNMSSATTATFRIYLYATSSSYNGYNTTGLNNVILNGTLALASPPAIITQPVGQIVSTGQSATFSVTASGSPAPTYQWTKNGANISGATSSTYSIPSVVSTDAGTYAVVITNSGGSVTSSNASLVTVPADAQTAANLAGTSAALSGMNIGASSAGDSSVRTSGNWWLDGSGSGGINGSADNFHFEQKSVTGDFQMYVNLAALYDLNGISRAGLMIRDGTSVGANFVALAGTSSNSGSFKLISRTTVNGASAETTTSGTGTTYTYPAAWMMLERTGTAIHAFVSSDDVNYYEVTPTAGIAWTGMSSALNVGVFCASGSTGSNALAVMNNFSILAASTTVGPLLTWDFTTIGGLAANDGTEQTAVSSTEAVAMAPSTLVRGTAATNPALQANKGWGAMNTHAWTSISQANAESVGDYYQFTVQGLPGAAVSLSSLSLATYQQNAHATATIVVEYSLNGFATAGTTVGTLTNIHTGWTGAVSVIDVSTIPALQNVTGTITFRLCGFGFTAYEDKGLGQISGSNGDVIVNGIVK